MTFVPGGCCDDYPECYHRVLDDEDRRWARLKQLQQQPRAIVEHKTVDGNKLNDGDTVTIEGVFESPPRNHWWQFWRERTPPLRRFTVRKTS